MMEETPQQREITPTQRVSPQLHDITGHIPSSSPKKNLEVQRRSSRTRKPVERFDFRKTHGYSTVRIYLSHAIMTCVALTSKSTQFNSNYLYALALDPSSGIITDPTIFSPDFLIKNPNLFKAKKGNDPDTPGMMEALSGPYRDEFLEAMGNEITELEHHGTWEVVKKNTVPDDKKVLPGTWAFRVKRYPSGEMKKIKARFCARGDLQTDVDEHDTFAPVTSWSSIS